MFFPYTDGKFCIFPIPFHLCFLPLGWTGKKVTTQSNGSNGLGRWDNEEAMNQEVLNAWTGEEKLMGS